MRAIFSKRPKVRGIRCFFQQFDTHVIAFFSLARLLLARNPASQPALLFLTEHTGAPRLVIPHLHYLARLCAADPENALRRKELATLRKLLLGS